MAVRVEAWRGRNEQAGSFVVSGQAYPRLSLQERVARLERRRRASRAQVALETSLWLAGTGAVSLLVFAGVLGLR